MAFLCASDACVKSIVYKDVAINAINFLTFWTFEEGLVVEELTLTCIAMRKLILIWHFNESFDGKEMMI